MTLVTVTGAAKLARVSRGTIYNKIENGELSKGPDGIDTTELLRVFGTLHDVSTDVKSSKQNDVSNARSPADDVMARQNDEITQRLLEQLEEASEEKAWLKQLLKEQRDIAERRQKLLDEQGEKLLALLPAPGEETELAKAHMAIGRYEAEIKALQEQVSEAIKPRKRFLGIF